MGVLTAVTVINKCAILLLDTSNVRWPRAELLGWLNEAQKIVSQVKPNSTNITLSVKLAVGTRQNIPTDGWLLLDVIRNMGSNGSTPGQAIRVIAREIIDNQNITWHSDTSSPTVQNYMFSLEDQVTFYVYPPADGTAYIELNYSQLPTQLASETNALTVNDIFESVLIDYIMFRSHSKDAEYAAGVQLAEMYLNAFQTSLGMKDTAEMQNSPNLQLIPRDNNVRGAIG